mmetsp:Transcript_15615/g.26924  ORF Transcript_15615/g.26924 Transcript_15615/m.26924 type:complete len:467 (-) Transcript_15615:632-2032(-)|eukprot:CAMPEP_0196663162 /NCGR_PEP_ID=MMETSP1086-20130531/51723_1 /TAXON_ID=77921 /ORGANISM="Cyanoptyche  gloeocystis , Strain SAG4.97" /LENGTH=466 /DNA_ID=CAMNT_0041998871 /DNA_START=68 /DNA_END=1468 /DNA_ORIENTATION=-
MAEQDQDAPQDINGTEPTDNAENTAEFTGQEADKAEYDNQQEADAAGEEAAEGQDEAQQKQQSTEEASEEQYRTSKATYNIFVGDLVSDVSEDDLRKAFEPCGEVVSVHVIRYQGSPNSKGFGFVHFATRESQQLALSEKYKNTPVKGRPCRAMISETKDTVFVGNLPMELNEEQVGEEIKKLVSGFEHIELKTNPDGKSRGFAFLKFPNYEKADKARKKLANAFIKGRMLNISWAENQELDPEIMSRVRSVYLSNLPTTTTEEELRTAFGEFGKITKCIVIKNPVTGQAKGFAFIDFEERESVDKAIESFNLKDFKGQKISVELAKPQPSKAGFMARGRGGPLGRAGFGPVPRGGYVRGGYGGYGGPSSYGPSYYGGGYGSQGSYGAGPRGSGYPPRAAPPATAYDMRTGQLVPINPAYLPAGQSGGYHSGYGGYGQSGYSRGGGYGGGYGPSRGGYGGSRYAPY